MQSGAIETVSILRKSHSNIAPSCQVFTLDCWEHLIDYAGRQKGKRKERETKSRHKEHSEALAALLQVTAAHELRECPNPPTSSSFPSQSNDDIHQGQISTRNMQEGESGANLHAQTSHPEGSKTFEISRLHPYATDLGAIAGSQTTGQLKKRIYRMV